MSVKKKFRNRLNYLFEKDKDFESLNIKEDTFKKYIRGDRFPKLDILEKIKNHYNVPYSYLFGEYDNNNLDTSEISGKLGLSKNSIEKLEKIGFENDIQKKQLMIYALNQIIENIDFLEFGNLLLIPSIKNKHFNPEEIYEYYSNYIDIYNEFHDYEKDYEKIRKKQEYNDFIISKRLFTMFNNIRKSQECATTFMDYVDNEKRIYNNSYKYIYSYDNYNDDNDLSHFQPSEEMEKLYIQELINEENRITDKNKDMVEKRKNIIKANNKDMAKKGKKQITSLN